ncbi:LPXTG cell wall anchor domain-containing protein [Weissella minor]|nr:LPXTG cell wall anchor domain-containing protein [Weissella minor]MBS0949819.1 LPXTG cell wall anchor domain-containing protein [Weissella minor]
MVIEDPYFLEDLSDSELDDFLNTYYYNVIDMYNELLAFIEANGADDDLLEALADMEEYIDDFEDIFDYVFDDYVEEDENSADQGQGVSINPEAIGATNHNTADTRMAKYHGQANALPETASDQQNGLAIAGAALLAGLGALGFAKKRA